jgi:hypothetical protein
VRCLPVFPATDPRQQSMWWCYPCEAQEDGQTDGLKGFLRLGLCLRSSMLGRRVVVVGSSYIMDGELCFSAVPPNVSFGAPGSLLTDRQTDRQEPRIPFRSLPCEGQRPKQKAPPVKSKQQSSAAAQTTPAVARAPPPPAPLLAGA